MLECVELFAGAGGLSLGLKRARIQVKVAVDSAEDCRSTYLRNHRGVEFILDRVQNLTRKDLLHQIERPDSLVLAGGPPCQLFSRLNRSPAEITDEVRSYIRLVRSLKPLYVVFENVPAIKRRSVAWDFVIASLSKAGYDVQWRIVRCSDLGIPQCRDRMIVLASKVPVSIDSLRQRDQQTVRDAIGHLPDVDESILNHKSMKLSDVNLRRIKGIKEGQNSRSKDVSFADSYARMSWDRPAPTITTKCISFSNGRFGHPSFNRAITVREAANLQSFPESYEFVGNLASCARQVGNAVPPRLGEALGKVIVSSYKKHVRNKRRRA